MALCEGLGSPWASRSQMLICHFSGELGKMYLSGPHSKSLFGRSAMRLRNLNFTQSANIWVPIIQIVPNLQCFEWFFYFMMGWKQYALSRKCTLNFEFWSSPGLVIWSTLLSSDAGQCHCAEHEGEQLLYLEPFCTCTTILFFTFSTVFNKLHEIFNSLL